ncbi:calcium-binding protein [Paracoccus luteus]|uniref:calcium-binding protein n=1 Tax=Paracoccus luteus TaxID=2508543 RepID=UPI001FE2E9FC|nr:calcium-binding protein [Paracoccus luteus]
MVGFRVVATLDGAGAGFVGNLTDLTLGVVGDRLMLFGVTHMGGGQTVWSVTAADRQAVTVASYAYGPGLQHLADPQAVLIQRPGGTSLLNAGLFGATEAVRLIGTDGTLGPGDGGMIRAPLPPDLLTATTLTTASGLSMLLVARHDTPAFTIWRQMDDGRVVQTGWAAAPPGLPADAQIDAMTPIRIGSVDLVATASTRGNYIALHRVLPDGTLAPGEFLGTARGSGFNGPRDIAHVEVEGHHFLIVSGAGSSSLTTVRVMPGGLLVPVDHILDERTTRFQNATVMEAVSVDGRAFVIAGGADDGLSLFTVTPDGRLLHLQTIADADDIALADVSALAAHVVDGRIVVFAGSATEPGLTQFVIDPGTIGQTRHVGYGRHDGTAGNDLIQGGGDTSILKGLDGDDILIAGSRSVAMYGGRGADLFVPLPVAGRVAIKDYEPGIDRLDLSMLGMIRSTMQLRLVPQSWGIKIRFGDTVIDIYSRDGRTLLADMFDNALFPVAHYVPPDVRSTVLGTMRADVLSAARGGSTVWGMAGDDTVLGSGLEDRIIGGIGRDRITANGGDDTVQGDAGDDTIRGGTGLDLLVGGDGNDQIFGEADADRIIGNAGDDTLTGGVGNDVLTGGDGADLMTGDDGHDTLMGEGGDDRLQGGAGNDVLIDPLGRNIFTDWLGNNLMVGGALRDMMHAGSGADTLRAGGGDDYVSAGAGRDRVEAGGGNDLVLGGAGDDTIFGDDGNDTLLGHSESDLISGGLGHDLLNGGLGRDTLMGDGGHDMLIGDAGADVLRGGDLADTLHGGLDDDQLFGNEGGDRLFGGDGHDTLMGDGGADLAQGDAGNDLIGGGAGFDTLLGGAGDDTVLGGDGDDLLGGGEGGDLLAGDTGADTLRGNQGNDTLSGGAGHDLLEGGDGDDALRGDLGDDRLIGGGGNDTLAGAIGDDTLWGNQGDDHLVGGQGNDTLAGGGGHDRLLGEWGRDGLDGGAGNDTLAGGADDDTLHGGAGDDSIDGGSGADALDGGDGADTLQGGAGADLLQGGRGDDVLESRGDGDRLLGGEGADAFLFLPPAQLSGGQQAAATADRIADFQHGADVLDLSAIGGAWIGGADFSGAGGVEWRWLAAAGGVELLADLDGDRLADLIVLIEGVVRLTGDDLLS